MSTTPRAVALSLLKNESDHEIFSAALHSLIISSKAVTKSALKESTQFEDAKFDAFCQYYLNDKKARIELRTSIENKMLWQHKSDLTTRSLSQTVESAMTRVNIHVMPTTELNAIAQELVRFNSLVNQLAKWCNTYKSAADAIAVLTQLDALSTEFSTLQTSLSTKLLLKRLREDSTL
ncbi:hypothetical protein A9264_14560 [Vibrio sp. UCD-FRSSP16_10]|uniref:plasmid mobilization relaxosome protein MobC n=1 Tax=unclassified Vibrio TaxID=2614977 RepID=UPI0007FE585E|nr:MULTISPECIES: plasmid mobilization relaxosome protein MobC [unclassified Vibrio]OBT13184.1 hypothetical protein A9260_14940 [Vibrio sp. UCD-FRSSP16_30]OBT19585.1 hypothetical protein A9264_14560 [Vibrio sp. UCD-FRSSP16_10]